MPPDGFSRRTFFSTAAAITAATSASTSARGQTAASEIPKKKFGRHPDEISILGLGGHHLGNAATLQDAISILHEAVDNGVNFCDNAWEYNDHRSEEWMGQALRNGYREKVFLMTKVCTHGRDESTAMQMLEDSLRRLGTDHLDLWQIHAVVYDNDPDLAYRKGGVIDALRKAKQQGKVRYLGFTGHKDPRIHKRMIDLGFEWDAVQFPINAFDAQFRSFQQLVLPEAVKRGIAVLGMKPLNGDGAPFHKGDVKLTPEQALRFAMSVPGVTTTITGMESLAVVKQNMAIAKGFQPLQHHEMQEIIASVTPGAGDGRYELYKTSLRYDGAVTRQMHEQPLLGAES